MLAQQNPPNAKLLPFFIPAIQRDGDWLKRPCPECHQIGYVSIYPDRLAEAFRFILRKDWVCKPCADIRREVDQNFYARGGDAIVTGYQVDS